MEPKYRENEATDRRQLGTEKLRGHDIMAIERFDPEVRHMIVFDVLSSEAHVGYKGDKMRLFLSDEGYKKALKDQEYGFIKIKIYAKVRNGYLKQEIKMQSIQNNKTIAYDIETTGLDPYDDEIVQISVIDGDGNILINEKVRPVRHESWPEAEAIHGITPEMVSDCKTMEELRPQLKQIFDNAELIIGYNMIYFDNRFLSCQGIDLTQKRMYDVMLKFAPIYGERRANSNEYKWQKLSTCAKYYGYTFKAHDSLEDTKATLFAYKKMTGVDMQKERKPQRQIEDEDEL